MSQPTSGNSAGQAKPATVKRATVKNIADIVLIPATQRYFGTNGGGVVAAETLTTVNLADGQTLTLRSAIFGSIPKGGGVLTFRASVPKGVEPPDRDGWIAQHQAAFEADPLWSSLKVRAEAVYRLATTKKVVTVIEQVPTLPQGKLVT